MVLDLSPDEFREMAELLEGELYSGSLNERDAWLGRGLLTKLQRESEAGWKSHES
jgi:hypothetical protein